MKTILNFGAGVNSTALIIEMLKRNQKPDYIIFADTGNELPETYEHLKVMENWFKEKNLNFVKVQSKYINGSCSSLYDYYFERTTIPFRRFRDCTDKFKIVPITKFLSQFKKEGVIQNIGISAEEWHRVKNSPKNWIEFKYPLVDWKIDRKKCIEIIKEEGLSVPIKSGCYLCPFQPVRSWVSLYKTHKDLFQKSRELEENGRSYPKVFLPYDKTLAKYENAIKTQKKLTDFEPERICGGWCFT